MRTDLFFFFFFFAIKEQLIMISLGMIIANSKSTRALIFHEASKEFH